jgi:hypothetical protein
MTRTAWFGGVVANLSAILVAVQQLDGGVSIKNPVGA